MTHVASKSGKNCDNVSKPCDIAFRKLSNVENVSKAIEGKTKVVLA